MPTSPTEICNLALGKLGSPPVASLEDDSKSARLMASLWASVRDAELRDRPWAFAMKRAELPADAEPPAFGYARRFALPADCLRLVNVGEGASVEGLADYRGAGPGGWQVEGDGVLSDLPAPLRIRYVGRITDAARFDAAFVQALACRLAAEAAEALTQSPQKRQLALAEYQERIAQARRTNAIEAAPEVPGDDTWVLGRL